MPNILSLTASPIKDGSTDILLHEISRGIATAVKTDERITEQFVRLNDFHGLPCQACGKSPEPDYCFYHDDIYSLYQALIDCDIVLFGSPIYFDTVSSQAKIFIDRCNCLRPPDFEKESRHPFKKIIAKKRLGGMVLSGGERENFECARKVIAGFFKWVEIENIGLIAYAGSNMNKIGTVREDQSKLLEAGKFGQLIYERYLLCQQ
jgi:multimeric flavodoxin WrbA